MLRINLTKKANSSKTDTPAPIELLVLVLLFEEEQCKKIKTAYSSLLKF